MDKWISIKDELPRGGLCFVMGSRHGCEFVALGKKHLGGWLVQGFNISGFLLNDDGVTHWCYVPERPKKKCCCKPHIGSLTINLGELGERMTPEEFKETLIAAIKEAFICQCGANS